MLPRLHIPGDLRQFVERTSRVTYPDARASSSLALMRWIVLERLLLP
jgi:hypothetical protein